MKNIFNTIDSSIQAEITNLTIKKANIYRTIFVFILTSIFAYLLIQENMNDYERAIFKRNNIVVSEINSAVEEQEIKKELKSLLIKNTIAIGTLAFILFLIILAFDKIFNSILQRDIQVFLDFFQDTAHDEEVLNPNDIFFKEFKMMVGYANTMVDTISEQKKTLKNLNLNLEDKIKEKTSDLVLINKNLEKEKIFSQNLLHSQKEFLRYAVHETNTPLSVMLTSIELFVMKNKKDRQLSKIEAAVKNIFNIYDDLSYLVKKDQVEYPKIAIEIDKYLTSRIDFFKEVAEQSKIQFKYVPYTSNVYIYFNETKLQRIIDNTITNAIKYTLADEIVDITLRREGSFLDISMGSKSKEIKEPDKIFDSFYREAKQREGFGIGLGLVKNICKEEGVVIALDSTNEKTTFSYRFKMMGE